MRSPREALEGLTVLPAPSLGLRFLVYTMRAWTPAWTPKMSSVTGGLGRSPPAVTETPRPRLRGAPTSPLLPHLSELPSQGAGSPAGTWGRGHVSLTGQLRGSVGNAIRNQIQKNPQAPCQPRTILTLVRVTQNWGVPPPPSPGCATARLLGAGHLSRAILSWLGAERGAGGGQRVPCSPSLRPKGPDEGFRPFL